MLCSLFLFLPDVSFFRKPSVSETSKMREREPEREAESDGCMLTLSCILKIKPPMPHVVQKPCRVNEDRGKESNCNLCSVTLKRLL